MDRKQQGKDFTTTIDTEASPEAVFAAINDVRGWWKGQIAGGTAKIGDEFTYRYDDLHYSKQRIVQSVPGQRVVWQVLEAKLTFVSQPSEWQGTEIIFEISPTAKGTEVRFTHKGLVPEFECYEGCSGGWRHNIDGSLRKFIAGK